MTQSNNSFRVDIDMPRPRCSITPEDGKKTEPFTVRFPEAEAMSIYREASRRDLPPAVLLRRFIRLGMAASSQGSYADDNDSSSDFASLGDAEIPSYDRRGK